MSIVTCSWLTRGYELDQDGLVSAATWLRYAEQLRWESMGPASRVELSRVFGSEGHLVVVAQRLELARDLGLGQRVWGDMTLIRTGRSSLDFGHLLRRDDERGEVLGRARVTAVHVGSDRRPKPLPAAFRELAGEHLESAWADGATLAPLELPGPSVPEGSWEQQLEVRHSDQDLLRHVNHARYLEFVDDCRRAALAAGALGPPASGRPVGAHIEYRAQAVAGEQLTLQCWVSDPARRTLCCLVLRGGTLLTRAALRLG